jgi:fumarate reductase subunit D
MIVVVVRFPLVRVHGVEAEEVILQAVRAFVVRVVRHRMLVLPVRCASARA